MTQYLPKQIENMMVNGQKKAKLSESVGGRGEGTLIFKQQGQDVEAYYRYRHQGKDRTLAIGRYGQTAKVGMTLSEIRDKARELARIKKEIAPVDLKEYLELEQLERVRQQEAQKKKAEMEANLGSLKDMCESMPPKGKRHFHRRPDACVPSNVGAECYNQVQPLQKLSDSGI